jgi:hypothetical protein
MRKKIIVWVIGEKSRLYYYHKVVESLKIILDSKKILLVELYIVLGVYSLCIILKN